MKKDKKEDYCRSNTHRVCIKLTKEQHEYLIKKGKVFGKFGMSEAIRQIIDKEIEKDKQ